MTYVSKHQGGDFVSSNSSIICFQKFVSRNLRQWQYEGPNDQMSEIRQKYGKCVRDLKNRYRYSNPGVHLGNIPTVQHAQQATVQLSAVHYSTVAQTASTLMMIYSLTVDYVTTVTDNQKLQSTIKISKKNLLLISSTSYALPAIGRAMQVSCCRHNHNC